LSPERVFGLLNVHKPPGPTSHDVVTQVRRGTRVSKVGHAGTLDPMASGVLVLCLGPATRLSEYVMRSPKRYEARLRLGITTDTYDAEGEIVEQRPLAHLTAAQVEAALDSFRGDILQVPPMYSAIKRGGKKLYNLARAGQNVPRDPRPVTIFRLDMVGCDLPFLTLAIECSPGTYIRSLAYDLGEALGVGGHLTGLVRVGSGVFRLEDAVPLAALADSFAGGTWRAHLLPPDLALGDMPALELDAAQALRVANGNAIETSAATGQVRAVDPAGNLLAILDGKGGFWQPVKVFPVEG